MHNSVAFQPANSAQVLFSKTLALWINCGLSVGAVFTDCGGNFELSTRRILSHGILWIQTKLSTVLYAGFVLLFPYLFHAKFGTVFSVNSRLSTVFTFHYYNYYSLKKDNKNK